MQTVYLSLGSNIGERQDYLHEAVHLLGKQAQILVEKQSQFYETSPVGNVIQDNFINLALKISTTLEPFALLTLIHEIEAKLNRERKIHWGPRTIDIDIIFYGELELNENNLVIPHKEVFNRLFVLIPLLELLDKNSKYFSKIEEAVTRLKATTQTVQVVPEEKSAKNSSWLRMYSLCASSMVSRCAAYTASSCAREAGSWLAGERSYGCTTASTITVSFHINSSRQPG